MTNDFTSFANLEDSFISTFHPSILPIIPFKNEANYQWKPLVNLNSNSHKSYVSWKGGMSVNRHKISQQISKKMSKISIMVF